MFPNLLKTALLKAVFDKRAQNRAVFNKGPKMEPFFFYIKMTLINIDEGNSHVSN